jgi:hypothetical protein
MRLDILIQVDYDRATVPDRDELRKSVEAEAMVAIGRGLLTTEDEAIVDGYKLRVEWANG